VLLTGYLEALVREQAGAAVEIITPSEPAARGAALSLRLDRARDRARAVFDSLRGRGFVPDWREPGVIRVAAAPFYNGFEDIWRFVDALRDELHTSPAHPALREGQ